MSALKRLNQELINISESENPLISAYPNNDDMFLWYAQIIGPEGTPYENGVFKLEIKFSDRYPYVSPKMKFLTKIYHCNISPGGEICLDILKSQWTPVLTLSKVLLSICSLLNEPNASDPLNTEAGKQYTENINTYNDIAKSWTYQYAMNFDEDENN